MSSSNSRAVALVTGGSRGIGRACVSALQAAGYQVAAVASTETSARQSGADFCAGANVADPEQVRTAVERAREALGELSVVVNNAGVAGANQNGKAADDALWHRIFEVNVHGTYNVCNAVIDALPDQRGRIINMGSVLSARGVPDQTAYCAAKHAVLGYTRALAQALAPRGITVNCICPGWVETDMARQRADEMNVDVAALAAHVPMGRCLSPDEVAACAVWLASEAARNVTGQGIFLDGGVTA